VLRARGAETWAAFALGAALLHTLNHAIFKALLFLGAGAIIHAVGSNDLSRMGGLWRRMPQTGIVFVIGTLSLAGVPLFAGYLSKEEILGAVWLGGLTVPFALLLFVAFLTAFYMFRVVFLAFFGTESHSHHPAASASAAHPTLHAPAGHHSPHDPPASMMLPLWALGVLSMAVGIGTLVAGQSLLVVPMGEEAAHAPGWLTPTAVGAALAGITLAWLTYQQRSISAESLASMFGPIRRAALARFWIDDLFEGVLAVAALALSRLVGWVDRYLVDGVLNVVSAWTVSAGDTLRGIQTGRAQDYVFGLAVGVLLLLFWVRWAL
jgi:NADH-quinone oxidoreductase subunit L